MPMNLDRQRLTSADPREDAERQYAELKDAEGYLTTHSGRTMVDYTGRGRYVVFEPAEMLLAVRAAKDRLFAFLHGETSRIDDEPVPDPSLGFAQTQQGGEAP